MRAPFSDDECVLAEWEIEECDESGKGSRWRTEGSGTLSVPFYVDDGTDRVLVRPDGATVELSGDRTTTGVGIDETPPAANRSFRQFCDRTHALFKSRAGTAR